MRNFLYVIFFGALLVSVTNCSSEGGRIAKNAICPGSYNPLPVTDNKKYGNKLELKPGEPFNPAPSEYAYGGSELYYYDTSRDIKIHLAEAILPSGETKVSVVCLGGSGISAKMNPVTFSVTLVSDLFAEENKANKVKHRTYSFDYRYRASQAPLQYSVSEVEEEFTPGSPQDSFVGEYQEIEQTFATLTGSKPAFQLVAHLKKSIRDQRSDKDSHLVIRTMVSLTPDPIASND